MQELDFATQLHYSDYFLINLFLNKLEIIKSGYFFFYRRFKLL